MVINKISLNLWGSFAFLVAASLMFGCGPLELPEPHFESKKALVKSDLDDFTDENAVQVQPLDDRITKMFHLAFGGIDGASLRRFIDERIQYYLDPQDLFRARMVPAATYNGWFSKNGPPTSVVQEDVVEGASNIGSPTWFQGVLDGSTKTIVFPRLNLQVRLDSSRIGIMVLGPGYTLSPQLKGERYETTPLYRQGIIVHEARHSDCTGGLRQREITAARSARNTEDFEAAFQNSTCNHFHVICPPGHDFAGTPACDRHPWGAYAYGYLFAIAKKGPHLSRRDQVLLQYAANDSAYRLLYLRSGWDKHIDSRKMEAFKNGRFGLPDRSSSGVVD